MYLEFCSCLNITIIPQILLLFLASSYTDYTTLRYFQRQAWIWKIFKIPHLKLAEKSHPCYQWGHFHLLAHIFIFTEVQFCAADHTQKMSWNQPNPGEEPRRQKRLSHAWGMNASEVKKERKRSWLTFEDKKGADKNQAEDCPHHGDPRDAPLARESSLFAIRALMLLLHP